MNDKKQNIATEFKKVEQGVEGDIKRTEKRFTIFGWTSAVIFIMTITAALIAYFMVVNARVYIENSVIQAPEIDLSPTAPGILENVYVKAGDSVTANQVVARVGDELIKTKTPGIITKADAVLGAQVSANETVVAMIDPTQLRVMGKIDENKGLNLIRVGQHAIFTVDAFGSKEFQGIVDEVSPEAQA
ncbi:MAG: efflux RND transporter periplasmic adaptor subunit, partial [Patescibacteria group bacterium]|nr:efflux RND transporter periplasmic adaptor subunit [Patescibacteria group bacterium]